MQNILRIKKVRENAIIPEKATIGSAGMDLTACIDEPITIKPNETIKIPTGIAVAVPSVNHAALVFARSGISIKHGLAPANCVGLIDSDYRGEIIVGLHNHSLEEYTIQPNERVAQLVIVELPSYTIEEAEELDDTVRGAGGFGSTGTL